jgi:GNAT superfamily N-acetyltransferase
MFTPRLILQKELSKYENHIKSLDADSKVLRFGYPISDEMIVAFCKRIVDDYENHIIFAVENVDLNFVGIGHIAKSNGEMELAFSVLKEYQGLGIGDTLMRRCIQWCRTHNLLHGKMVCLSRNQAIKHLCVKNGIHLYSEMGETTGQVDLDVPQLTTYVSENIDSNLAMLDYMGKRFKLPWSFLPETS